MYAIITTGGKQYRVEEGQRLEIERLEVDGDEHVMLRPVLLVDGETVLATPGELADAVVRAQVVGEAKARKINGFTYKSKTNNRRRWGHRQRHSIVEITDITKG